ncbi:MAG: regulatory iron-sulfur-containing complex subunit RicT [Planctomycetota bacterium]
MPKYVVRHGVMRQLGVFSTRGGDRYTRGARVIARTNRGQEAGEVLCEATKHVQSQMSDPRTGQILRTLSGDDEVELRKLEEHAQRELEACRGKVAELGLEMDLVDAEHLYGGERAIFYYLAEGRVDFRELVKELAREFQTRIEMRQIGVRDEAKLLADYGDCGKPVCCNTHLPQMPPVSMKMAKLQKATLDPTKISGRCGRLKCCLRYEYDTYRDMQQDLPRVGAEIITSEGRAKVLAQEVLAGQVLIQTEDMRRKVIAADEVLSVLSGGRKANNGESAEERSSPRKAPREKPEQGKVEKRKPTRESPAKDSPGEERTEQAEGVEQAEAAKAPTPPKEAPEAQPDSTTDGESKS